MESQQARSYRSSMRVAPSRGSSGPVHHFTGIVSPAATSRKVSIGQRLLSPLAKGWITAKFCFGAGGTGILGMHSVGGGSAGKNVKGRCRTASRNSGRFVPYQE